MSLLQSRASHAGTVPARGVDPRGLRLAAAATTVVLATALLTLPAPVGIALLAFQTLGFGLGAVLGVQAQPYGVLYRHLVRPRLAPPAELEDPAPPRFAQAVGLAFTLVALAAVLVGATPVAYAAVGMALAAAFLNAAFGFCLGCELYLRAARLRHHGVAPVAATTSPAVRRPHIEGETV